MNTTTEVARSIGHELIQHRNTRGQLAAALEDMIMPLPIGTEIKTASHTVKLTKVYCGCTQYGDSEWEVTGKEDAVLVDGHLVCDKDIVVWDGRNHRHRATPLFLDPKGKSIVLQLATAATLRSLAKELPAALAEWMAAKQADTQATAEAVAALKQT